MRPAPGALGAPEAEVVRVGAPARTTSKLETI